ncbi:MAG: tyrosine-type recombinase/integrase [Oscillospiraceae bacterium]|jgi:site-specific recombinase XerD|nr:tyrosine-type recombinase/integrase [Oscillospiraceae bacterium]
MSDYRAEAPEIVREFLAYHEDVRLHSLLTVDEYYLDLRTFLRFLKVRRKLTPEDADFDAIDISGIDLPFIAAVTKAEISAYNSYLRRDRKLHQHGHGDDCGVNDKTLYRKMSTLRSFFKYLTVKTGKLQRNPVEDWDMPKRKQTLPKYLTLNEAAKLLEPDENRRHSVRNRCILMIFLNCGLRISEICSLNLNDIRADHIRIFGKGGKERIAYLNEASAEAINDYLSERAAIDTDEKALFLSQKGNQRLTRIGVHQLVKAHLGDAGLAKGEFSSHKLRHTAATLMLRNGVDVRTLQELLGHESLSTTQIYTHVDSADLKTAASANPLGRINRAEN